MSFPGPIRRTEPIRTDPERLIGSINLRKGEDTNRGFWPGLTWHRQGLMTEACEAVTDFWFNALKFPMLRVTKAVADFASSRISKKSGMRIVAMEERDYVSGRLPSWFRPMRQSAGQTETLDD